MERQDFDIHRKKYGCSKRGGGMHLTKCWTKTVFQATIHTIHSPWAAKPSRTLTAPSFTTFSLLYSSRHRLTIANIIAPSPACPCNPHAHCDHRDEDAEKGHFGQCGPAFTSSGSCAESIFCPFSGTSKAWRARSGDQLSAHRPWADDKSQAGVNGRLILSSKGSLSHRDCSIFSLRCSKGTGKNCMQAW